jgi:hypothetical protein
MVVSHGQAESPDLDVQVKKRRPISPEKHRANIANSKCSTGPRSITGKAIASANAVSHGMTCKTHIFLPGESHAAYDREVAQWGRQLGAVGGPEFALLQTAVYCRYRQCRVRNAQGAAGTRTIELLDDNYHDRTAQEIRTLLPRLPMDPGYVVQQLRKTTQGCSYLIEQFMLIKYRLVTHSSFEVSQRREFLLLCGRNPVDLFRDPMVLEIDRLYLGAISGPGSFTADEAANALLHDRPAEMSAEEFTRRLEPMVQDLPTIAEGHAALVARVEQTITELTERLELVGLREERDRAIEVVEAGADVTPADEKLARYHGMATREQHSAFREFRGLVELRHKYGEGQGDLEDEDQEATEPPPAPQEPAQNEATVPEVVENGEEAESQIDLTLSQGERVCAPPSAEASAVLDSPEEHEAIRSAYHAQLQRVLERIEQDQANTAAEFDGAARDRPPPEPETSA